MATFSTVRDLCTFALKNCGIIGLGQTANAEQIGDAHIALQAMMNSWRKNRWLVFRTVDSAVTCDGRVSYTVGPSGDINLPARPDRLETGNYYIQLQPPGQQQTSWPLFLIQSRQDYNLITLKRLTPVPYAIWYDPELPLGKLYPWPIPSSLYELHIVTKHVLDDLASLNDDLAGLPPEFEEALWSNLAIRCGAMKGGTGMAVSADVKQIAATSLENVKSSNYSLATLRTPRAVRPIGPGSSFNIYTGFS